MVRLKRAQTHTLYAAYSTYGVNCVAQAGSGFLSVCGKVDAGQHYFRKSGGAERFGL